MAGSFSTHGLADIKESRLLRLLEVEEISDEVQPRMCAFACALGGADGRQLFAYVTLDFDVELRKAVKESLILRVPVAAW
ncbi:hypothetical protein ACWC1C_03265 [Streptomyces sp. NPDC001705]